MCRRVTLSQQTEKKDGKYEITPSLCLAINNIDYVLEFIQPFVAALGMEETLEKLETLNGEMVANSCRRTLQTLVQNAVENVENKIFEILDTIGEKMAPVIQKFLVEGSALVAYAGRDKETLIQYLDKNMIILKEKLNNANFEKVLSVIWDSSALSLSETIHLSIEVSDYWEPWFHSWSIITNQYFLHSAKSRRVTSRPCLISWRSWSISSTETKSPMMRRC